MIIDGEETLVSELRVDLAAPAEASVVQIYGPNLGQRYALAKARTVVGRDADSDIVIDSDSVSRAHAAFVLNLQTGTVLVTDLGSTNGTALNDGETSDDPMPLKNGDIVKLGSVMLKFLTGGSPEALYHEEIYRLTICDGLTGIANRRYFDDFFEREMARASRYGRPLTLILFDLDNFKRTNDVFGHVAGDFVLRRMANEIERMVRREELLARYGGEEFALVMPETSLDKAIKFAEKIRRTVAEMAFEQEGQSIPCTVSLGVATLVQGASPEHLIRAADAALYRAKANGRNRLEAAQS